MFKCNYSVTLFCLLKTVFKELRSSSQPDLNRADNLALRLLKTAINEKRLKPF